MSYATVKLLGQKTPKVKVVRRFMFKESVMKIIPCSRVRFLHFGTYFLRTHHMDKEKYEPYVSKFDKNKEDDFHL